MVNGILLGLVQSVLGKGNATSKGNYAFHCPLCNHRKPKLEINLVPTTKNENPWHCWACDIKGKTIASLFKSVKADREKYSELNSILGTTTKIDQSDFNLNVELPKEYKPLYLSYYSFSLEEKNNCLKKIINQLYHIHSITIQINKKKFKEDLYIETIEKIKTRTEDALLLIKEEPYFHIKYVNFELHIF